MRASQFERLVSSIKEMDEVIRGNRRSSREFTVDPKRGGDSRKKIVHRRVGSTLASPRS